MQAKIVVPVVVALAVGGFFAYNTFKAPKTNDIGQRVQSSLQGKIASDPDLSGLTVNSVSVVHKGGNEYKCIASCYYEGQNHEVPLDVTDDGNQLIWQSAPGAFAFIVEKKLQNMNIE